MWRAVPSEQGEHGEEGIELMMQRTPHTGSPKIPAAYSVVDVAPSESGYETDATAFSEKAFSDEEEDIDGGENECGGLLLHHGASGGNTTEGCTTESSFKGVIEVTGWAFKCAKSLCATLRAGTA